MSLNFVSTSVLSSTDGVSHNTETQLDPSSSTSTNQTYQKPLYEQLRDNSEKDQEKYDEMTKAMRGTTTLNEEDVAFIHSVENRKAEIKNKVKRKEEEEIQMFRAARLEKTMMKSELVLDDDVTDVVRGAEINKKMVANDVVVGQDSFKMHPSLASMKPTIIRKRRRKTNMASALNAESSEKGAKMLDVTKRMRQTDEHDSICKEENPSISKETDTITTIDEEHLKEHVSALGGLLAYGSDSDSE